MSEVRNFHLHNGKRGAALTVHVTPRSLQNEVTGVQADGMIKIRLAAIGTGTESDQVLLQFLADVLGISVRQIEIVAGTACYDKLITVLDIDPDSVQQKIMAQLKDQGR